MKIIKYQSTPQLKVQKHALIIRHNQKVLLLKKLFLPNPQSGNLTIRWRNSFCIKTNLGLKLYRPAGGSCTCTQVNCFQQSSGETVHWKKKL